MRLIVLAIICLYGQNLFAQVPGEFTPQVELRGQLIDATNGEPLPFSTLVSTNLNHAITADEEGYYELPSTAAAHDTTTFTLRSVGYKTKRITLGELKENKQVYLVPMEIQLATATITDQHQAALGQSTLRDVEGVSIYAGRKNELILPDQLQANLATNNAREIFKGVAGLTVWESDAAGLQLSIGARGLNPNRSSNFNTRQNGFDISADALGYPESYYTPPAQALQRIELVRGAASLQYGTQFGGLLNFKLKEGPTDRKAQIVSEQTVGSFGLFSSFNSIGGTIGKVSYYAFGQYKRGNGWRENSGFSQGTGYLDVHYQLSAKTRIGIELTRMHYLAQQPGGLVDFEFAQTPRRSKRDRNWFEVDWGLAALHFDHNFSDRTKLNIRTFVLDAKRDALGELGPINRPDPERERELIRGTYRNFGQEVRFLHRYTIRDLPASLVVGSRVYSGRTTNQQGLADAGSEANFSFLNPERLETSAYEFPSRNYAVFAEHLVNLSPQWSVTPGVRYEYIRTAADGFFRRRVTAGGELLLDTAFDASNRHARDLVIAGLGLSYRPTAALEAYANASQNYRAINFSDLVVVNPNLVIDSSLSDERGFNLELGFRGSDEDQRYRFDVSLFYLRYANRIGVREILLPDPVQIEREVSLRTNIGAANMYGVEAYAEVDLARLLQAGQPSWSLSPFINASLIHGRYVGGGRAVDGKAVELVPPLSLKTGLAYRVQEFESQLLLTHVREHFTDATNAVLVADATRGIIPTYTVLDFSASYTWKMLRVQTGINNLLDRRYFTRRATGYPGPGIIPAEGRSFYLGLRLTL